MQKPSRPRIPHAEARLLVEGVLQRLDEPTPHLLHVERLIVFGSFAYGLLDVDDVDLAIDYVTNDAPDRAALEAAAGALDQALAAIEVHEQQLEQDDRGDARQLAMDTKTVRQEVAEVVAPTSEYLSRLRQRHVPQPSLEAPKDDEIKRLEAELQRAYDDWASATKMRVPFPQGTPPVGGAGLNQMIDEICGGSDRIYVYPEISALDDWAFDDLVLLWERGDSLDLAMSRLATIKPNPAATRKQRKPHGVP
jgi:hypothetical protein